MIGYLVHYRRHSARVERDDLGVAFTSAGCNSSRPKSRAFEDTEGSTVLFGIHPLVWANTSPDIFRKHYWDEIVSWQEFEDPDGSILASFENGVLDFEVAGDEEG